MCSSPLLPDTATCVSRTHLRPHVSQTQTPPLLQPPLLGKPAPPSQCLRPRTLASSRPLSFSPIPHPHPAASPMEGAGIRTPESPLPPSAACTTVGASSPGPASLGTLPTSYLSQPQAVTSLLSAPKAPVSLGLKAKVLMVMDEALLACGSSPPLSHSCPQHHHHFPDAISHPFLPCSQRSSPTGFHGAPQTR